MSRTARPRGDHRRMTKDAYVRKLMYTCMYNERLYDAVFIFWHSGVPLEDARKYLKTLSEEIK